MTQRARPIMPQPLKSEAVNPKEGHQQGQTKGQQRGTQMLSSRHQGHKVTCEAADPRAEKQLGAQPHTLQSREQVCLRVWGWVGHGSNAVGWGRVVPSNPRPGRPFWTSVTAPSLAGILWKPSHFVCNCPSRVPGSSARLMRGRPCKQLPKPAEGGGGGGEVNCLENHQREQT